MSVMFDVEDISFHNHYSSTSQNPQGNKTTMSSPHHPPWNATSNATSCDGCDGGDELRLFPNTPVDVAITVFSLLVFGLCAVVVLIGMCRKLALAEVGIDEVVILDSKEERKRSKAERRRKRRELILNGLIVKEWMPVDPQVESTTEDQDTPTPEEAVEAPQPPVPPINSSLVSCEMGSDDCESLKCEMGSDDCESLDGEEEMAECAICLRHLKPHQLVSVSNNSSCQHVFHKDCMVDWLMKDHNECPMCREVYLKTV
jgi:hypothetical protein